MSTMQGISPQSGHQVLEWGRKLVEPALRAEIEKLPSVTRRIANFHFGWEDENGYPISAGAGKALRPTLVLLSCEAVGGTPAAAVAVELVHNFSLLYDDVMDCDTTRRNRPTAWSLFGLGPAILAGDALLSLAFEVLLAGDQRSAAEATRLLGGAVQHLIDGQLADLEFESRDVVSLAECESMAQLKTGALLRCCSALGALVGGATPEQIDNLGSFGAHLGLAYQHVDDLLGIWGDPRRTGKPVHSDLRRRKKSLPVVAALTSGTPASEGLAALYQDKRDASTQNLVRTAELIELTGGRRSSETAADALVTAALAELSAAAPHGRSGAQLESLARLTTHRDR